MLLWKNLQHLRWNQQENKEDQVFSNSAGPQKGKDPFPSTMFQDKLVVTPPKFNIAPEKRGLADYFPIAKVTFQGLC